MTLPTAAADGDGVLSEGRQRRLFEDSPVAIGLSDGGRVVHGNPAFFRLFGLEAADLQRPVRVTDLIDPASHAAHERRTARRARGEAVENVYEMTLRRLDGGVFSGLVSVSAAVLDGMAVEAVYVQDLTETVAQRAALQRERDRAEQYLRISRALLLELDAGGCVQRLNERGCEVLGYSQDELLGRNWFDLFRPPDEVDAAKALFAEVMTGTRPFLELHESRVRTRSGESCLIAWRNGLILDVGGRIAGLLSSGEDITRQRLADDEMKALNARLEQGVALRTAELEALNRTLALARDAAEAGTRAKGEFLAHMSHEIRTPMNAIVGMTHLALQAPAVPERVSGYLTRIQHAADALLAIINDVLDFSKLESGRVEIESESFELSEVLDRVTALVAQGASDKGLEFLLHTAGDVPPVLVGDPLRLGQVLLNLCGNAVKFTSEGEIVVVTVKAQSTEPGRVRLRFAVRDTGIGIAPEQLSLLFQPFEQLDGSITRRFGGTGLGLAISQQLVQRMGGRIEVRSEPGRGSEFHFTLDFQVPGVPAAPVALAPAAEGLTGLRCLVVDDSPNAREVLCDLCAGLGVLAVQAASGAAALHEVQRARQQGRPFDAVLLDWKMPELDGLQTAARLRQLPGARPRLVLVTAYGADAVARQARAEGFAACLAKPVTAPMLADALSPPRPRPDAQPAARPGFLPTPRLTGRRVLLVEDNELNQIVAADLLGDLAGATVTVVANGRLALDHLARQSFDVVLMDLQMPELDGYETTAAIRRDLRWQRLPVIAMSAHVLPRERERCLAVGMNDFVGKPFDPRELFAVLARWLPPTGSTVPDGAGLPTNVSGDLDPALGVERCLGRPDLYRRVLARFVDVHQSELEPMRAEAAAGTTRALHRWAHTLMTSAATVGADGLATCARNLQSALDDGTAPAHDWPEHFERTARSFDAVLAAVRRQLAAGGTDGTSGTD